LRFRYEIREEISTHKTHVDVLHIYRQLACSLPKGVMNEWEERERSKREKRTKGGIIVEVREMRE
jgi:hypothetical protein